METSASVSISSEKKLKNLATALEELHESLGKDGRFVAASFVFMAATAIDYAGDTYQMQSPDHD